MITKEQIIAERKKVQGVLDCNIKTAQSVCTKLIHSSPGGWRKWETGERGMHPALWELFQIKVKKLI